MGQAVALVGATVTAVEPLEHGDLLIRFGDTLVLHASEAELYAVRDT